MINIIIFKLVHFWRRQWHPTPVLLPGKSHGRQSLVLQSLGCCKSDTTERLRFHFSLSCTGEGNGKPLQCSCLENPRDGGAWWAAVSGVAQSQTRLKRFSCSCSSEKEAWREEKMLKATGNDLSLTPVILRHGCLSRLQATSSP